MECPECARLKRAVARVTFAAVTALHNHLQGARELTSSFFSLRDAVELALQKRHHDYRNLIDHEATHPD
jgi:hypothetical protein